MTEPLEMKEYMLVITPNRGGWETKHNTYRVYRRLDDIYELLYTNDEQYKIATYKENLRTTNWFHWVWFHWVVEEYDPNFIIKPYDNIEELLEENAALFI